jgi:hypothetical protein
MNFSCLILCPCLIKNTLTSFYTCIICDCILSLNITCPKFFMSLTVRNVSIDTVFLLDKIYPDNDKQWLAKEVYIRKPSFSIRHFLQESSSENWGYIQKVPILRSRYIVIMNLAVDDKDWVSGQDVFECRNINSVMRSILYTFSLLRDFLPQERISLSKLFWWRPATRSKPVNKNKFTVHFHECWRSVISYLKY